MGIFDWFSPDAADERINYAIQNQNLQEEVSYLTSELRDVQEDMLRISDAFDNAGWTPLDFEKSKEMDLKTVKKVSELARAMYVMNPFIKRGVSARYSYIWGKGVSFDHIDSISTPVDANLKKLFSTQAYSELEAVLATDGNAFTAVPTDESETAFRIPLARVVGSISNPNDIEEIWYYRVEIKIRKVNGLTGEETTTDKQVYYVSLPYYQKLKKQGKSVPKRWGKLGVDQDYVLHHMTVNKQVGWRWGVPDIMPVIFWAKAYKEYLEDNAMLVKAYSRLAWQVKASSGASAQAASTQVMTPPTRDPLTGELRSVGGTAVYGSGSDLSPIAATGSDVDFSKGAPLASAIAAGLEIPLIVITSDAGSANRSGAETLDLPTLKAMESRQRLHTDRFLELFEFWGAKIVPTPNKQTKDVQEAKAPNNTSVSSRTATQTPPNNTKQSTDPFAHTQPQQESQTPQTDDVAIVTWPQIESDSTKDRIAALGTAVEEGTIFKQEMRKEALDVFGIAPYKPWDVLPTMADDPAAQEQFQQQQVQAQQQFDQQQEITKQTIAAKGAVAAQGKSGGTAAKGGAMSTNNQSRDNRKSDSGK